MRRQRRRWTSPAESTRSPASVVTRRPPSASIPAATPSPPSQRTSAPSSASRRAQRRQRGLLRLREPGLERGEQLGEDGLGGRRGRAPRRRGRSGARGDVDADPDHRPALVRAALDQHAGHLAAVDLDVVGPLHACGLARHVRHRETGAEREQRVELAQHERAQQRRAGGRLPAPALPPAAGGLRSGGHERAVRRPGGGELARPPVGRVDLAVVQPRPPERGHDGSRRTSSPGSRPPSVPVRPAAVDRQREHPGGVLVEQQLAGLGVGEGPQVARAVAVADRHLVPEAGLAPGRRGGRRAGRCRSRRPPSRARRAGPSCGPCAARAARAGRARRGRAACRRRPAPHRRRAGRRRGRTGRGRGRWRRRARAATTTSRSRPPR